jgi:UDP-glucose 4-epimerase
MKILMTGGSGFLGTYVERECQEKGHEFISYDMARGKDILNNDALYWECANAKPDVVIHAAAIADLYKSEENRDLNFSINVQGTYFIGRICSILNIPLIYISTCCAYGNQSVRRLTDEDTEPIPTDTYAWSKLAGEKALGCVGSLAGFILRLGTFYGPGMRSALFNAAVIEKAIRDETITIHGDGEQTRRYIHVADVASAIVKFCDKATHPGEIEDHCGYRANPLPIFNILGIKEISVNETVEIVGRILGKPLNVTRVPQRQGQIIKQMINCNRAMAYVDWEPKITYEHGMRECVEWHKTS